MESKKVLEIKAAICDVRNAAEELLAAYSEVRIKAAALITNQNAQALLGRYAAKLTCANILTVAEEVSFSTINGPTTISAGQIAPDKKLLVSINGPLTLEPGCEEVLKSYASMIINGPVLCPASMTPLLNTFQINGPVHSYPDGSIVLKKNTILDRVFHLRAKQDALYYAPGRIVALAPDINFAKLAEKNVRFSTKTLLVAESMAEAAVPLFDEKADIVVLPDGCAYVNDDAELNEALLKRYGGTLYINGDLTVTPDSEPLLDQISYLRVNGDLLVPKRLKDRVMAMDLEFGKLYVVGGVCITSRSYMEMSAGMLKNAEDGLSVISCADVVITEDVSPELLREKLVSIVACATVRCTAEQRPVVEERAQDVANISCGDDDGEDGKECADDDGNTVKINAAFYTL